MIGLTVFFDVKPAHIDAFKTVILAHAHASVLEEPGCRQFDVSQDPIEPSSFFLYEIYDDEAALESHRATDRIKEVGRVTAPWVESRKLLTFRLVSGQSLGSQEIPTVT
jgi:quinol monooxygenase YgiN